MRPIRTAALLCIIAAGTSAAPSSALAFEWPGKLRVTLSKLRSRSQKVRLKALIELGQSPMEKVKRHLLRATDDLESDTFRLTAARILVEHRVKEVLPVLVDWLADFDLSVRVEAARLLGKMGNASAVGPLLRTFGDFEHKVRMAAVLALGRIGSKKAITGILGRLNDPNVKVRKAAIAVLSDLTDSRAIIPLLGKLTDPSREIRLAAVKTLAKIADPRAVSPLLRLLKDPVLEVRLAAIAALGSLRSPTAVAALIDLFGRSSSLAERKAVLKTLGRLDTPAARRTLLGALGEAALGESLHDALVAAGSRVVAHLAAKLTSSRLSVSSATLIVRTLRDIGDRRASPALVREFRRGRVERKLVVEAMATCGDSSALIPLLVVATGQKDDQRRLALNALLHIADQRAIEPLLPVLKSPDSTSRLLAVRIMGKLKATRAVGSLMDMLEKDTLPIRVATAHALGRIGDRRAAPKLLPLLGAKSSQLRLAAFNGLAALRARSVLKPLLETTSNGDLPGSHRALALDVAGAILRSTGSKTASDQIIRLAADPNQSVATAALTAMGAIASPVYIKPLLRLLKSAPRRLRPKVIDVLGSFASAPVSRALLAMLHSKHSRYRALAAWSLGSQGKHAPRAALLAALSDPHLAVRINAVGALARLRHRPAVSRLRLLLRRGGYVDPNLRAAAVLALGLLGDRGSAHAIARLLQLDASTQALEANAVRALRLLGWSTKSILRHLEILGDKDLLRRARRLLSQRSTSRRTWVGLDIRDELGNSKHALPIILTLPDGMIRWTLSDERGKVYAERIPPGVTRYSFVRRFDRGLR